MSVSMRCWFTMALGICLLRSQIAVSQDEGQDDKPSPIAQLSIQQAQLLSPFSREIFFKLLAEEGNAVIGTAVNRQTAACFAEVRAGTVEIGGRGLLVCQQISQQVGQCQVMSAASTAGASTYGTRLHAAGGTEKSVQIELNCANQV